MNVLRLISQLIGIETLRLTIKKCVLRFCQMKMQRIEEEDALLLSIARERVRNERSAATIGRNGEYVREIESFY